VSDHDVDAYGLIRDADAAMYSAKESGPARRAVFTERLRERAVRRITVEAQLRRGIDRDEFLLHYQPIVDLRSGAWVGAEALVRWEHPSRGLLAPSEFIPLAEESGLIVPLGLRILDRAVRDRSTWPAADGLYASVNLSAVQLADPTIAASVADSLRSHGLTPAQLVVEVTETALMVEVETARDVLEQISASGVRVVIDDFGSGYSSVARLADLPMTGIKIDRTFTVALGDDPKAGVVVAAITDLAHALDLEVVVEGIETAAARAAAAAFGCEFGQGYHLSRPVPLDALAGVLARRCS
jgi:EAL domain-containing protein (putative c-di-GMP-specific phosphodiesterase class I)